MIDKLENNGGSQPDDVPGWLEPGASTNERRRTAVKLKLQGLKLADIAARVGLSSPSIINAHKAFQRGGWDAVDAKPAGRAPGRGKLDARLQKVVRDVLLTSPPQQFDPQLSIWTYSAVRQYLQHAHDISLSQRVTTRYCEQWGLTAHNLQRQLRTASLGTVLDTADTAGSWWQQEYAPWQQQRLKQQQEVQWVGVNKLKQHTLLYAYSSKNTFSWTAVPGAAKVSDYLDFFNRLSRASRKPVNMVIHGIDIAGQSELLEWFGKHNTRYLLAPRPLGSPGHTTPAINSPMNFTASTTRDLSIMSNGNNGPMREPVENADTATDTSKSVPRAMDTPAPIQQDDDANAAVPSNRSHLQRLEAESIHIMREVVAEADNPVMLYSSGKDSAVMLHLALKAFYPAKPPFPLLHIDTTWKFSAMYEFRDKVVAKQGMELLTHVNQEGLDKGVNPFTHGSGLHTDIMKTEALKQAIDKHGFDIAFGGARRDEEKSRAKERVFSFRTQQHRWDPKQQRPELWRLYNTRKQKGESIRAFPLSNWTELDIWQYILQESIDIVPLYFAAERPVVERDGSLIMVDDDRLQLQPGEVPMMRSVRFRTLGCYPLTSAIESNASNVKEIIVETLVSKTSERSGRLIDHDAVGSMEKKKQEGYF